MRSSQRQFVEDVSHHLSHEQQLMQQLQSIKAGSYDDNNNNKHVFTHTSSRFAAASDESSVVPASFTEVGHDANVDEGFRRELGESIASIVRSGKGRRKKQLGGSAAAEEEPVRERNSGERESIAYQSVPIPDKTTSQIDDMFRSLHKREPSLIGKNSTKATPRMDRKQNVLADIDKELQRFRNAESYEIRMQKVAEEEKAIAEQRYFDNLLNTDYDQIIYNLEQQQRGGMRPMAYQ